MGLFKSKRQRELEAEIQVRQSKSKIERFIRNAKKVQQRYWKLGKQALRLGDREQFEQLASALMRARDQANHWERYLLQMETLNIRREEVAATGEFIKGISAVTSSILRGANPDQIAAMQVKMEQALVKTDALQEVLSVAMETSADSVFGSGELDEGGLDELASQMGSEAEAEEGATYDAKIATGLQQIEEQMRKEL
ncbi:MAG: Snf7 family protein [Pirellulales bacterium]